MADSSKRNGRERSAWIRAPQLNGAKSSACSRRSDCSKCSSCLIGLVGLVEFVELFEPAEYT